jgi:predicted flap endonuclease-1-like 5' DNA nuclease
MITPMFQDLNPLGRPTAILEIAIMLLGAAIIGFLIAWILRKPKLTAVTVEPKNKSADEKPDPRIAQLEKSLEALKAEKTKAEAEFKRLGQIAKDKEAALQKELEAAKVGKAQPPNAALDNAKKQIADLQKALDTRKTRLEELEKAASTSSAPALEALKTELAALKTTSAAESEALKQENIALKASATNTTELEALQKENAALQSQITAASPSANAAQQIEALQKELAELKSKSATSVELTDSQREIERQLREQQRVNFNLQAELTQLRSQKASNPAGEQGKEFEWLKREKEDLENDVRDLEGRIDRLEKDNSDLRAQARDKSSAGPAIEKLTKERDRLKAELEKAKRPQPEQTTPAPVDFSHLGIATAAQKDPLIQIIGIGPVVEGKLNQLGIYTFAQISRLSDADMDRIDEVLQLFPGRVKRENWVEQAGKMVAEKE